LENDAMKTKPRLTRAVRDGWDEVRALALVAIEAPDQHSQFKCRVPEEAAPDPETCECPGCTAVRSAEAAISWIDARMP
jgi:hypothetical protein